MTDLITGGSGFIGRRLRNGHDRVLMRCPDDTLLSKQGDLLDLPSLRTACANVDHIFHCAGYAHTFASSDPNTHWRINYEGTVNLLRAAGEAGVRSFVFLSSVKAMAEPGSVCADESIPGEPITPYGRAKRAAEDAVMEAGDKYGMHVVNLRLAMVYGPGGRGNLERMVRGVQAGWFPPLPETGNKRSLVHVDDVVSVMRLVATAPEANRKTYIVADEEAYSGREIYDAIRSALEMSPARWRVPVPVLRFGGRLGDGVGQLLNRTLPLNCEAVSRLLNSAWYSPGLIKRELGWTARIGLEDGLGDIL